ncbi:MAG: M3 family metallopeptidase [Bacteroidales bacterium]|nr:M3 family metallopeptidase [Bacteroidales bacterium]
MNLLLQHDYATPYNTFPFADISLQNIEEALLEGMRIEKEEIKTITEQSESPNFQNTIVALAQTGQLLERATTLMYNQLSALTSDELEALAERVSPVLSKHSSDIMLNEKLFDRVRSVYESDLNLEGEDAMLLKKTYEGFERSGATLSEEKKQRFRAIKVELSQLSLQFSQNNIKATNAYVLHLTDVNSLAGLPEGQVEQARAAAKERDKEGWIITLHAPSYVPFMQYSTRRDLREQLYRAYMTRCANKEEYNNFEICRQLVNLRMELAQLLGYQDYAEYVLTNRMAQRADRVQELLDQLIEHYLPKAQEEVRAVEQLAQEKEGSDFCLQPWDFAHYAHLLQLRDYDLDSEMLRPYFELNRVTEGVFSLATTLYGVTFVENKEISVYHEEVKAYEVRDSDGSHLAVLYTDFFPRASKQNGAWMTSYREQCIDAQQRDQRPHVSVTMNFTKPTATKPALLTFDEVQTFLHEFGHALHGIFARSHYSALSGTNVFWDFVELPSQFMENYAYQKAFLETFARHYETGELIPTELLERLQRASRFNVAYACMRQVSFGLLDMAYYTRQTPLTEDIRAYERQAWERVQLLPSLSEACMTVQFGHIMSGGYAAGYYSYKWAEVLDADAFEAFVEVGVFSPEQGQHFRNTILSRGGTEHPQQLYLNFRGREPKIDALLRRDGLLPS